MVRKGAGDREFFIYLLPYLNKLAANDSFGLRKQSSQKPWTRLLKILAKTLKNTCEQIHF